MTLTIEARCAGSARERQLIDNLTARLQDEFSSLPADDVARRVMRRYQTFAACPVRDFIVVLVERASREDLVMCSVVGPAMD